MHKKLQLTELWVSNYSLFFVLCISIWGPWQLAIEHMGGIHLCFMFIEEVVWLRVCVAPSHTVTTLWKEAIPFPKLVECQK